MILIDATEVAGENLITVNFVHQKYPMSALWSNLGLHGERPRSSSLRIGMPLPQHWTKVMVSFILSPQGNWEWGNELLGTELWSHDCNPVPQHCTDRTYKMKLCKRFKMLFSLQPWSLYWCFSIFHTSSDWSSLFILKHSHSGSSEMYGRVCMYARVGILVTIFAK